MADSTRGKRLRAAMLYAALLLGACGGGGGAGPEQGKPPPGTAGLDARPQNLSCIAPARTTADVSVTVTDAFPDLPAITAATKILVEPGADPRWFVLRKSGRLLVFDPDNATSTGVFLDLSGVVRSNGEGGLLGMAFHPDYPAVPEIFLSYTRSHTGPSMRSVVSRFILDNIATPGAGTVEQVILEVDQDFDNHNGGDIAFGPDRRLYIGLGDGGGGGDPNERAQDTRYLLGSFLRIDVLDVAVSFPGNPYVIPGDNPFAGNTKCGPGANANSCPEIYAWGMRNPWRWSFDPPTGALWAGDVGHGSWEEIDLIERGGNYGWDCREGAHDFEPGNCVAGLIDPVAEYPRASGNSVTGGFVYRGADIPALAGRYVFGDFGSGRIWALQADGQGGYTIEELVNSSGSPSSFGVDQNGELFYIDYSSGRIMQLVPTAGTVVDLVPDNLSDSGCVDPDDVTQPYAGLVPYETVAPFWSDGAGKERFIGLPDGTTIAIDADDDFVFPNGTVLVKNFTLADRLIETRHLMLHPDGVWHGYTYEWNAAQTEATRVRGGKTAVIDGQDWIFPDEAECLRCHTGVAGRALGPETAQLNGDYHYASTGRTANQLATFDAIGMFATPLPDPVNVLPTMPDPADTSAPLAERARAYLHTNCAQCHQPDGPTPVDLDLRYTTLLNNTNTCDVVPQAGDLGLVDPRIIMPGNAERSVLVERVSLRDANGMPPLGSSLVDDVGVALLTEWVDGLINCN